MKNGKCEPKNYCLSNNPCSSKCVQVGVGINNVVCGCQPGYYPDNGINANGNFY